MSELKCIIADDEPIARQILENYINEVPNLTLIASCKDALEVLEVLQSNAIDLLFLDINMPKLSGLSLLKTMQIKPQVIITTAYPEYALEGFELSVTDYLVKPFSLERYIQAVMKVKPKNAQENKSQDSTPQVVSPKSQSVFVKSDKKLIRVDLDVINYIEAYGNYIKIHADELILSPQTLTDFIGLLPDEQFIRIHKSFVINFSKLKVIEGNELLLDAVEKRLPIGKSFRKSVMSRIDG